MSYWNYRPCKIVWSDGTIFWDIRSVYYNNDGTISSWSEDPAYPLGDNLEDLKNDLDKMSRYLKTEDYITLHVRFCDKCKEKQMSLTETNIICSNCSSEIK